MMTTKEKIQHLSLRAGFGLSPAEYRHFDSSTDLVKKLFSSKKLQFLPPSKIKQPQNKAAFKLMDKKAKKDLRKQLQKDCLRANAQWVRQMIEAPIDEILQEKMSLFWHGHFACSTKNAHHAIQQINTIRQYALGNFRDLVLAISKDAAMIKYLNNQQNKKKSPNENYARELMELFTLGRDTVYTEQDIKAAARAFTGWFSNRFNGQFHFQEKAHDFGEKVFMGRKGQFNGDDIIDIILEHKECAKYICSRIYRYFVNKEINQQELEELSNYFYQQNYHIGKLMRFLFERPWFYDTKHRGRKIKSPIELFVGMGKTLKITAEKDRDIILFQRALGQLLFRPPNVAGWPGGQVWIDNSTLNLRLNYAGAIYKKTNINHRIKDQAESLEQNRSIKKLAIQTNLSPLIRSLKKTKDSDLAEVMRQNLLSVPYAIEDSFILDYVAQKEQRTDKIELLCFALMSLPEYQLC